MSRPVSPRSGTPAGLALVVAAALAVLLALAGAAAAAPHGDGDRGRVLRETWAELEALLAQASEARRPALVPPTPVPVRWGARRVASISLDAPLLALGAGDLDGDHRDELLALTASELVVLGQDGRSLVPRTRARLAAEPAAVRPRDPVGTLVAADVDGDGRAEVAVRSSEHAWGAVLTMRDGALVEVGRVAGFPLCPGTLGRLASGRNYFEGGAAPGAAGTAPVPPQSSSIPPQNPAAPPQSSSIPPQNPAAPPQSSSIPPQDSVAPRQSSSIPPQDSVAPPQDSVAPRQSSAAPRQSSSIPPQNPARTWLAPPLPPRFLSAHCRGGLVDPGGRALAVAGTVAADGSLWLEARVTCASGDSDCQAAASARHDQAGTALTIADMDRDGRPEIAFAQAAAPGDPDAVRVLSWAGDTLTPVFERRFTGGVAGLAAGDFDGDGAPALVGAVRLLDSNRVDLWLFND